MALTMSIDRAYVLKLECIGDDTVQGLRMWDRIGRQVESATGVANPFRGGGPKSPWVAEITGTDPTYGLRRNFLKGSKDYSEANSKGSRGVHLYFVLRPGKLFEVYSKETWGSSRRYFAKVVDGSLIEIERAEVDAWVSRAR